MPAPETGSPRREPTARLFFALELPDDVKARVAELAAELRRTGLRASWVLAPSYHVTVRFLGDVRAADVPGWVGDAAAVAARHEPFAITVRGAGAFPSAVRPRVLWAGGTATGGSPEALAADLEELARRRGLRPEPRRFAIHVTVARAKGERLPLPAVAILEAWRDREMGTFACGELVLFESRLESGPPRYVPRARLPLGGAARLTPS
jgi:2'-5' RNA ligase